MPDLASLMKDVDHRTAALWAADCAERVLHIFESAHPDDNRPRNAIDAARRWADGGLPMTEARRFAFASHAAARGSTDTLARFAARSAGHAAATAHVITHAPHAADYALKATSENERVWQVERLLAHRTKVSRPPYSHVAKEQQMHWDSVYSKNRSYFGDDRSGFCGMCMPWIKKSGFRRMLELGPGQGRDACAFVDAGLDVTLLDYSAEACDHLKNRFECAKVIQHDLSQGIPNDLEFEMCYSHMLLTMDFTDAQLMKIMNDIRNKLPSGGLMMFSVRNKDDPGFRKGVNLHDDVWENNGFAVNYFSKDDIIRISEGFEIVSITGFEEGDLPKRLYGVILRRS